MDMELVGTSEIAELAATSRSAVSNWVSRDPSFPKPIADLACGQIWAKGDIETWLSANSHLNGNRPKAKVKLDVGQIYTHDFICKSFGGDAKSGTYLPQSKQTILCGCFTDTMNPEAPDVVLVGGGPRIIGKAEKLKAQGGAIPVFMKRGTNQWEYRGRYELESISRDAADFEARAVAADRNDVTAALFFHRQGD
jgi:predicted DNA-binding transcriptional regulator AlpA